MVRTQKEETPRIRRPANCFIKFRSAMIMEYKDKGIWKDRAMKDFAKEVSALWWAAPVEVKAKYVALAQQAKEEHKRAYPEYRYRPRKKGKAALAAKTKNARLPAFYGSPSSSSSTSSSASTPAPVTPPTTMTMLAGGSPTSGNAFGPNFGGYLHPNHQIQPGAHATGPFQYVAQSDGYPRQPQASGLAEPFTYTNGMAHNANFAPLRKDDQALQGFSKPSYYREQSSYAPQQAFPPFALENQLQTGIMSQELIQPPSSQTFESVPQLAFPQAPRQAFQHAPQHAVQQALQPATDSRLLTSPVRADAAPIQPHYDSVSDKLQTPELGAWNKEFAPLDAGFCDFLSAWNNVKAPAAPAPDTSSSTSFGVSTTNDMPSAPAALPPASTAVDNLDVNVEGVPAQTLPSAAQEQSLFSSTSFLDPSFLLSMDDVLGQQYNELCDALRDLPASAVWPEGLNQQM